MASGAIFGRKTDKAAAAVSTCEVPNEDLRVDCKLVWQG